MSERRAEKSRGPCTIDGIVDTGTIGLGFANVMGMVLGNQTGAFGLELMNAPGTGLGKTGGSMGMVLVCTEWTGVGSGLLGVMGLKPISASTSAAQSNDVGF